MQPVSESFLLTTAQIAAAMIGLFLLGVFFYVETGFRNLKRWGPQALPFFRAFTKLVLLLYVLVLGLSLALAGLNRIGITVVYVAGSALVLAALLDVTICTRHLPKPIRRSHAQIGIVWPPILAALLLPWVLEGWGPSREAMTWTLYLGGAFAFYLTASLVLFTLDLATAEVEHSQENENLDIGSP